MKAEMKTPEEIYNITKIQDDDGHWYWIPNSVLPEFKRHLNDITGIDYMDDPVRFDDFIEKYEQYRTGGDPDNVPSFFEDKVALRPEDFITRGTGNYVNCTDYDDAIKAMQEYADQQSASLRQEVERLRGLLNIGDIEIAYIVNDKLNKTANGVRLNDTQRSPIHDGAWILAEHLRNNSNATTHHGKGGTEG